MPVSFTASSDIKSLLILGEPGYPRPCDDSGSDACTAGYTVTSLSGDEIASGTMQWDAYLQAWKASYIYSRAAMQCDTDYNLNVLMQGTGDIASISRMSTAAFRIICQPTVVVSPREKSVSFGNNNMKIFSVNIYNPDADVAYTLRLRPENTGYTFLQNWLQLCDASGTCGSPLGSYISQLGITANNQALDVRLTRDGSTIAGVYPLIFDTTDPSVQQGRVTLMVYGEALSEFSAVQLIALIVFSAVIAAAVKI